MKGPRSLGDAMFNLSTTFTIRITIIARGAALLIYVLHLLGWL